MLTACSDVRCDGYGNGDAASLNKEHQWREVENQLMWLIIVTSLLHRVGWQVPLPHTHTCWCCIVCWSNALFETMYETRQKNVKVTFLDFEKKR